MWIYGRNPVLEALRAGRARRVLVARGVEGWLLKELERLGAPYTLVPRIELDTLLRTTHHQGIAAEVEDPPYASLEDALRNRLGKALGTRINSTSPTRKVGS